MLVVNISIEKKCETKNRAHRFAAMMLNETLRLVRFKNLGGYICHEESLERVRLSVRPVVSEKNYPLLT